MTITGLVILLGSNFVPAEQIETVIQAIGIILAWYGRWRQKDINILGVKKDY